MILHESREFKDAIQATADYLKIRPIFIEKDYWVTIVLRNISLSAYKDLVVFKGGTSLSKAFNCIERFSEDIDLALIKQVGQSSGKIRSSIKELERIATQGLEYINEHPGESIKGKIRKTFHNYNKVIEHVDYGTVKDKIQLEITCYSNPDPYSLMPIESYIAIFFRENNFKDRITNFNLQTFEINVLSIERTFYEKVLCLIRLSSIKPDELVNKLRHFYDLNKLYRLKDIKDLIFDDKMFGVINSVKQGDEENSTFSGDWLKNPLAKAPIIENFDTIWKKLEPAYLRELPDLIWSDEKFSGDEVKDVFGKLKTFLEKYDSSKKSES